MRIGLDWLQVTLIMWDRMLLNPFGELLKDPPHLEQRAFLCLSSFMEQLHATYYKKTLSGKTLNKQLSGIYTTPIAVKTSRNLTALKYFVKVT